MSLRSYSSVRFVCAFLCVITIHAVSLCSAASEFSTRIAPRLRQFCFECHTGDDAEAELDLQKLAKEPDFEDRFRTWRKIADIVEQKRMPPPDATHPDEKQRQQLVSLTRNELRRVATEYADDPGTVTLRRLTSAEYAYTIQDLTGLKSDLQRDFVSDAVSGEGFTNVGDAQFVQDSTLQRYLDAARRIADHAVIGTGPLRFFDDPGKTGFELSAITRIQNIYRQHGFRTAAGEGGEAFGLDCYSKAFFVTWQFRHRRRIGRDDATLASLADAEEVDRRFAEYIWKRLNQQSPSFPSSEMIEQWRGLPTPPGSNKRFMDDVRTKCGDIQQALRDWQNNLGDNPDAKEEARILAEDSFDVSRVQEFEMNVNWPKGTKTAHLTFSAESVDGKLRHDVAVIWRGAAIQFRVPDKVLKDPRPLKTFVEARDVRHVNFGKHPRGGKVDPEDFVTVGPKKLIIQMPIRNGATSARLLVDAELDLSHAGDRVIRCTIAQREETDQGKSVSALVANPDSLSYEKWRLGVLDFARSFPQISHREPAPSDRDPIPAPFDMTYNNPDRNHFHARVKYHRDDQFLVDNILDDVTRKKLDQAWHDLLGSFEYHDIYLRFVAEKYQFDLGDRSAGDLDAGWIDQLKEEPRQFARRLFNDFHRIQKAFSAAQLGHVDDVLELAHRAWRRPLTAMETKRLRDYYHNLRTARDLSHEQAVRALISRILTAPDFLYRIEKADDSDGKYRKLSEWELASRLSYFLWSSAPDDELRRAAEAGDLTENKNLSKQAQRMLRNAKARRLATEFFGQWFGFYQFDRYRGVDPKRFPEFTDSLKSAMYDEAVSFFEYIVREDRPASEILHADYSFMNRELAKHYGLSAHFGLSADASETTSYFDDVRRHHRGGLFGLGAVLTATSAPRRTSPVKRGDWILRRLLGTPVPPPPADAGSIPADDVLADGKTVRQRLEAHRRDESCSNCHSRIDPLGFSLENYDAVGRWREKYRDGNAIDTGGTLYDGTVITGPKGLREYLSENKKLFHRTLSTKLAGYALGRRESICDVLLIEKMMSELEQDGGISSLVEQIVTSRQFQYRRIDTPKEQ